MYFNHFEYIRSYSTEILFKPERKISLLELCNIKQQHFKYKPKTLHELLEFSYAKIFFKSAVAKRRAGISILIKWRDTTLYLVVAEVLG